MTLDANNAANSFWANPSSSKILSLKIVIFFKEKFVFILHIR